MKLKLFVLFFCVFFMPGLALAFVEFGEFKKTEFSPQREETFSFPIQLSEDVQSIALKLYTVDGDLVRTLTQPTSLKKGKHAIEWDGKDTQGDIVPDEVYIPVIEATDTQGEKTTIDSRKTSGGEVVEDLQTQITSDKNISYTLPAPSRVLIRTGVQGGPLLRAITNWQPRSAGKNVQRWDGMDTSSILDIREAPGLRILVTAFQLPQYSVITLGNDQIDYAEYRKKRNWPNPVSNPEDMVLVREDARIERQHYVSPAHARDPETYLAFAENSKKNEQGLPVLKKGEVVQVRVDIDPEDRWLIDESLYEVAFFVDHEFVSEEEQGYLPLSWRWTVGELDPGQHVFTVNISAFNGKVGVASTLFEIEE